MPLVHSSNGLSRQPLSLVCQGYRYSFTIKARIALQRNKTRLKVFLFDFPARTKLAPFDFFSSLFIFASPPPRARTLMVAHSFSPGWTNRQFTFWGKDLTTLPEAELPTVKQECIYVKNYFSIIENVRTWGTMRKKKGEFERLIVSCGFQFNLRAWETKKEFHKFTCTYIIRNEIPYCHRAAEAYFHRVR